MVIWCWMKNRPGTFRAKTPKTPLDAITEARTSCKKKCNHLQMWEGMVRTTYFSGIHGSWCYQVGDNWKTNQMDPKVAFTTVTCQLSPASASQRNRHVHDFKAKTAKRGNAASCTPVRIHQTSHGTKKKINNITFPRGCLACAPDFSSRAPRSHLRLSTFCS